jgi:hypothetical protein
MTPGSGLLEKRPQFSARRPQRKGAFALSIHPRRLTAGALVLSTLVSACGQTTAASSLAPVGHTTAPASRATQKIDRMMAVAREVYAGQVSGTHSIAVLHQVGSDPTLLRLLQSGQVSGARAYVARQFPRVWYHWHVSRLRITHGSHLVTETGVPFVLPPSQMVLRGSGGSAVGTLRVSMQDEIGFVRLMHRRYPAVQVLIQGRGRSHLRTSMHAAAFVKLPASGSVSLGAHRYLVRSLSEPAWNDEHVTIWLLMKA